MNESKKLKVINKLLKISFILLTGTISTNNYTSNATIAFTDFSERVDDAGMYMSFDANTGCGILELTTESYNTELKISVGGHQKTQKSL